MLFFEFYFFDPINQTFQRSFASWIQFQSQLPSNQTILNHTSLFQSAILLTSIALWTCCFVFCGFICLTPFGCCHSLPHHICGHFVGHSFSNVWPQLIRCHSANCFTSISLKAKFCVRRKFSSSVELLWSNRKQKTFSFWATTFPVLPFLWLCAQIEFICRFDLLNSAFV